MKKPNSKYMKSVKPVRIGANRQMRIAEKRAKFPAAVRSAALRFVRVAACAAFIGGIAYSVLAHGHVLSSRVFAAVKPSYGLPAAVRVTGCSPFVQASFMRIVDSVSRAAPHSFSRAKILKAASAIPEIENVSVKKVRDASKEKVTLITVTERKPVAIIHNGGIFLVDRRGVRFSPVPGRFYDLPLLAYGGKVLGDTVDMELFNTIKKAAYEQGDAFFREISEIDLSGTSEVNLLFRSSDTEYRLAARDVENRLAHVKALKERLTHESAKHMRIDLRYRNLAFATVR
jgi:cell division septal protein FtsQ